GGRARSAQDLHAWLVAGLLVANLAAPYRPVTLSDKPAGKAPEPGRRRAHDLKAVGLGEEAEMARPVDGLPVAAGEADAGKVAAEDHPGRAEALPHRFLERPQVA